jgi:hypothetical protein
MLCSADGKGFGEGSVQVEERDGPHGQTRVNSSAPVQLIRRTTRATIEAFLVRGVVPWTFRSGLPGGLGSPMSGRATMGGRWLRRGHWLRRSSVPRSVARLGAADEGQD